MPVADGANNPPPSPGRSVFGAHLRIVVRRTCQDFMQPLLTDEHINRAVRTGFQARAVAIALRRSHTNCSVAQDKVFRIKPWSSFAWRFEPIGLHHPALP